MAFDQETHVFGVRDCKIALLSDDSGAAPTYDAFVDVPGIQEVTLGFDFTEKELKGDDIILDTRSTLDSITAKVSHAEINLDALPVILGGTTTVSGTTPNKSYSYNRLGTDSIPYFKIEAQVCYVDEDDADMHLVLYKSRITDHEVGATGEDYKAVSFSAKAIPCKSNNMLYTLAMNETAVTIS